MCDYVIRRSRRKTLSLEITRELSVLVRSPLRLSKREIDRFVEGHAGWISENLEKQRRRLECGPFRQLTDAEKAALRRQAMEYLPERVAVFSRRMGLTPTGIKITGAQKRYGSCSSKNSLCFSFRLMLCPPEAIDLVVVHELAHIRHKNHGREFYACIASVLPDYKARQKLLKYAAGQTEAEPE